MKPKKLCDCDCDCDCEKKLVESFVREVKSNQMLVGYHEKLLKSKIELEVLRQIRLLEQRIMEERERELEREQEQELELELMKLEHIIFKGKEL